MNFGFGPQFADLDGDGILDVISGSYWPGDITWFRGLGDGKYAKGEILKTKNGENPAPTVLTIPCAPIVVLAAAKSLILFLRTSSIVSGLFFPPWRYSLDADRISRPFLFIPDSSTLSKS